MAPGPIAPTHIPTKLAEYLAAIASNASVVEAFLAGQATTPPLTGVFGWA
jgi:hypothetical protein